MKPQTNTTKNILFFVTIVLVVGAIWYLESGPAVPPVQRVVPTAQPATPATTETSTSATSIIPSSAASNSSAVLSPSMGTKAYVPMKKSGQLVPELTGISGYVNTDPGFTLQSQVGKHIVLVDFWTYSCINCQRTLPYLTSWYQKYHDKGLEIVGVHSPEFDFEKDIDNVRRATQKFGIAYPVVLDNNHATWDAFQNRYWPHEYLIDIDGYIAEDHIGEGGYDDTEREIQKLLAERMDRLGESGNVTMPVGVENVSTTEFSEIGSPEIYLGGDLTRGNFGNIEGLPSQKQVHYTIPSDISPNNVYLDGDWFVDSDHVRLVSQTGKIIIQYKAKQVNIVASSPLNSTIVALTNTKKSVHTDVHNEDLYTVMSDDTYAIRTLELDVDGPGFKLYTFTFG